MLHAVEAPVLKLAAVAGAALLVGAFAVPSHDRAVVQRLELHAPRLPHAIYDTAWAHGDITVTLRDGVAKPLVFTQRGFHWGCEWEATEHLIPDGPDRYYYTYDEELLWCGPDPEPAITTPRTGYVLVVDQR